MKQGIVVGTHHITREFLGQFYRSLKGYNRYPLYVVLTAADDCPENYKQFIKRFHITLVQTPDLWEIGAIRAAWELTDLDEFFFFQDTFEFIGDTEEFFRFAFEQHEGVSVPLNRHFQMYCAKFRREALDQIEWPVVETKTHAVQNEGVWTSWYRQIEKGNIVAIDNDFQFGTRDEERFGRMNKITENEWLRKWKGTHQHNLAERLVEIEQEGKL